MCEGDDGVICLYVLSVLVNVLNGELFGLEVGLVYFLENLLEYLNGFGV